MSLSKDNIINLEDFRVTGAKVFTGRDRGLYVRTKCNIDELESKNSSMEIIVPNNIYSINPSFFEELFLNVVLKLGRDEFLKKFKFTSQGSYNYERPLNEAIDRILRSKSAIG